MYSEEIYQQVLPENYFLEFWNSGQRNDGRGFAQVREITFERLSDSSAIVNFGGNIVQASFSHFTDKLKIFAQDDSYNQDLISKINVEFEDCPQIEFAESCKFLFANFISKKYEKVIKAFAPNTGLKINLKCLFTNGNMINALFFSALLQFYFHSIKTYAFFLDQFPIYMPFIVKGFFVPSKRATVWLSDPNSDEEELVLYGKKGSSILVLCELGSKKRQISKLSGGAIEESDVDLLEDVIRISLEGVSEAMMKHLAHDEKGFYKIK
jgi:exosome complex RNA-binding protein Rrp42 (RNase PH superfamily)